MAERKKRTRKAASDEPVIGVSLDKTGGVVATVQGPRPTLESFLPGPENAHIRDEILSTGSYRPRTGRRVSVVTQRQSDGQHAIMHMAAVVSRTLPQTNDLITQYDDFNLQQFASKPTEVQQHWNIYTTVGVVNASVNKIAALLSAGGSFKVRNARKGKKQKAREELQTLLDEVNLNVNNAPNDGVVTGARGLKALTQQGVRQTLVEGDWFGRSLWSNHQVRDIGKFSLPMLIQSISTANMESIPEIQTSNLEAWYWKPDAALLNQLQSPKDAVVRDLLKRYIDSKTLGALKKDGKVFLDQSLLLHVKHRAVANDPYGMCYDDQTEILTRDRGWVYFADLQVGDLVAARTSAGEFRWERPTAHVNQAYDGPMCHFASRSMDLLVTPNHRMLITGVSVPLGVGCGRDADREKIVRAADLTRHNSHHVKIPVTSWWVGEPVPEQVFEDTRTRTPQTVVRSGVSYTARPRVADTVRMSGDDYCALMGAYLAEGNLRSSGGIEVSQLRKSKGWRSYSALFDRLGGGYSGKAFYLARRSLDDSFRQYGKSHEKFVPDVIRNATPRQLRIFWEHFVDGDGCRFKHRRRKRDGRPTYRTSISTASRALADHLVEIAQKLGMSAAVRQVPTSTCRMFGATRPRRAHYVVTCRHSSAMAVQASEMQYTGRIHCVQVPSGIVYVRRNGKPSWSGNSFIKPALYAVSFKRSVEQLDLVMIQSLINRLTIVMVGSSQKDSPYADPTVAQQRQQLMQSFFDDTGPNMTIVWQGDDVKVQDVGAHNSVLDLTGRHEIGNRMIKEALGIPDALLTGSASDGKASAFASLLSVSAALDELKSGFECTWTTLGQRIAEENNYTDVEIVYEFDNAQILDKSEERNQARLDYTIGAMSIRSLIAARGQDPDAEFRQVCTERGLTPENTLWSEAFAPIQGLPGQGSGGGAPGNQNRNNPGGGRTPDSVTGNPTPPPTEKNAPTEHS